MLCDSRMLGWSGGAQGVAAQVPNSFEIGSAPPSSRPRADNDSNSSELTSTNVNVKGLFERKLSKEEKKKLAEEKRNARKAMKNAASVSNP